MKTIFILLFFPVLIFSQSEFINKGQTGFNAGYSFLQNKNFNGSGVSLGISAKGFFDLGIVNFKSSLDDPSSVHNVKSNSNFLYIGFNLKNNNLSNFKVSAGFLHNSLTQNKNHLTSYSGILFSMGFSYRFFENETIIFMPGLKGSFGFLFNSIPVNFLDVLTDEENYYNYDNSRRITFDLGLIFHLTNSFHLTVTPSLAKDIINSGPIMIGFNSGLIFTINN